MAGIQSLMQGQQGPVPGQAPQQPMPGMMPQQGAATPQGITGQLEKMDPARLLSMYNNPQDMTPKWAVASAYARAVEQQRMLKMAQGQGAMAQNSQMQQQPPVVQQVMSQPVMAAHGGIMHGYAGGGAVAFQEGGRTFGYAPDYELARKYGINLSPYDAPAVREEKIKRARAMAEFDAQRQFAPDIPTEASVANEQAIQQAYASPSRARDVLQTGIAAAAPVKAPAPPMQPARRPPTGNKPPAMSQGLGFLAEQPPTPAPDTLSDIESKGIAGIRGVQDVLGKQGTVDPELMKLREAAYKSSQDIAARRERDRQAALEAAQKQYEDPTDLLLDIAGSAEGKTFGEVIRGAAKGASGARTKKRAELQQAQKIAREEQKANEDLLQALADKRVADMTGDVNQRREADRKVAEAELKVTELRSGIQKERALEADRAEQRKIAREQIANQLKVAQIGAAAKEGAAGLAEQRLALQAMRADPNYAAIVKELTEAKKMAGVSSSPTLQARLRAAEKAARDLASSYGVTPGMMGMGGAGAPAPAGEATNDPLGIRK